MRRLECGCELSPEGKRFLSLCDTHGEYVQMRMEAAKHPRHEPHERNLELERDLVVAIAPVVISRWSTVTDQHSSTEAIFQHIKAIMQRLD